MNAWMQFRAIDMKACKRCLQSKEISLFNKDSSRSDGYHSYCRECAKTDKKKAYEAKKEHYIKKVNLWKQQNKDKVVEYAKKARQVHRIKRLIDWNFYNTNKLKACPQWLNEKQKEEIKDKYLFARYLEEINGGIIKYHVDHIIPLRGKNVCGLHVPWNLQVLNATLNMRKGNRY